MRQIVLKKIYHVPPGSHTPPNSTCRKPPHLNENNQSTPGRVSNAYLALLDTCCPSPPPQYKFAFPRPNSNLKGLKNEANTEVPKSAVLPVAT